MLRAEIDSLRELQEHLPIEIDPDLKRRLDRALEMAACPVCAEAQADGVPCVSPSRACDHCTRALESVRSVREGLEADAARRAQERRRKMAGWEDLP